MDAARETLRSLRELDVDFVDTADSYGPFVSEDLIREVLHPYDGMLIATKGGFLRTGPGPGWVVDGKPAYLRDLQLTFDYVRECCRLSPELGPLSEFLEHRVAPELPRANERVARQSVQPA